MFHVRQAVIFVGQNTPGTFGKRVLSRIFKAASTQGPALFSGNIGDFFAPQTQLGHTMLELCGSSMPYLEATMSPVISLRSFLQAFFAGDALKDPALIEKFAQALQEGSLRKISLIIDEHFKGLGLEWEVEWLDMMGNLTFSQ